MKKLFVSLGLAAAGTAGLHAAYAPDAGDASKDWTLAATLRGFYDDNINTTPHKQGSVGFEVNPSFSLNLPLQQTEIGLRYTYGLYYYQQREQDGQKPIDQTHQFDVWLDHAFTPRLETRLQDTATVSQDPALTSSGTAAPQRINGNNLANTVKASLHTDWTRQFSTELSYANSFFDYEQTGATGTGITLAPSYAGSLNRVEQDFSLDLQWHVTPTTTALIGYQLGLVNYTGNEKIAYDPIRNAYYYSDNRDNLSHYGYVGIQHEFLDNLKGSIKAGMQYTTYYNDPSAAASLGPYGDASIVYTYAAGSYAQLGLTESRNATETVRVNTAGQVTQDQESTVVYGSINHSLTPKLTASLVGHFQYSTYNDGQFNNQSSQFYNLGLDLSYSFNRHLSSDIGYNFDYYTTASALGQDYNRNRVYLGITATY